MTEQAKELEKVKSEIRSLLISSPKGCSVKTFFSEYLSMLGKAVPFRRFGYSAVEDFLRSMPDVVRMQPYQNSYILTAVANNETAHIQKLISKQRNSTSGYRDPYEDIRRSSGYRPHIPRLNNAYHWPTSVFSSNNQRQRQLHHLQHQEWTKQSQPIFRPPHRRVIPALEKQKIKNLVDSYSNGLKLTNFDRAYTQEYGIEFHPENHGFRNLKECLASLSDTLRLSRDDGGTCVLESLVLRKRETPQSPKVPLLDAVHTVDVKPSKENEPKSVPLLGDKPPTDDNFSESFKVMLRRVLVLHPYGLPLRKFPGEYERFFGRELDCKQYGFHTVKEFVAEMKDVFRMEKSTETGDYLLFNAASSPVMLKHTTNAECAATTSEVESAPDASVNSSSSHVTKRLSVLKVKNNVEKVLIACTEGVRMTEFPDLYKTNCNVELPWRELGHESLQDFFLSLGTFVDIIPCQSGQLLLAHKSKSKLLLDSPIPECPVEPVLPGTDYKYATLDRSRMMQDKYFAVFVSHSNNPSDFWIQVRGLETTEALEDLMTELEQVYNCEEGNRYMIPDQYLKVNMVCAAIYPLENCDWHRVKVTKIVSPNYVEVFYVDYGTFCQVKRKYLRFLRKDFLSLEAQAIKARLADVHPLSSYWTKDMCILFYQMVRDKPLMAQITSLTFRNTVSVHLCDTQGEDDLFITDYLVDRKLVRHVRDDESQLPSPQPYPPVGSFNPNTMAIGDMSYQNLMDTIHQLNFQYVMGLMQAGFNPMGNNPHAPNVQPPAENEIYRSDSSSPNSLDEGIGGDSGNEQTNEQQQLSDGARRTPEEPEIKQSRYSQVIRLGGHDIHLINYRSKPYFTIEDLSLVIWGTKTIDLLIPLMKARQIKNDSIVIRAEDAKELFADLEKNEICFSREAMSVKLFPLESLGEIFTVFRNNGNLLLPELEQVVAAFDPADEYWTPDEAEETPTTTTENNDEICNEETNDESDLEKLFQLLKAKRLQLLSDMVEIRQGDPACIQELTEIDAELAFLKRQNSGDEPTEKKSNESESTNKAEEKPAVECQPMLNYNPPLSANNPLSRQVQRVNPIFNTPPAFMPNFMQQQLAMPQMPYVIQNQMQFPGMYYYNPMQHGGFPMVPNIPGNPRLPLNYPNWSHNH